MSELLVLSTLKEELSQLISNANMDDCELPSTFKKKFQDFGEYHIEVYNQYTTRVSSKKSLLTIPNQWFYIAAMCCKYHLELVKYKSKLVQLGITDDMFEECHPSKDNRSISEEEKTEEACKKKAKTFLSEYSGDDKELLIDFLWNYDSWGGGKNIKRSNDFTESPVLNIANSINASSGLIGTLAKAYASHLDAVQELWNSNEWRNIFENNGTKTFSSKASTSPGSIRSRFIKFWSLTDQHGATHEEYITAFENLLNPILAKECGISSVFEITDAAQYKDVLQRIVCKHGELEKFLKDTAPNGDKAYSTSKKYSVFLQVLACTNGVTKKHRLCGGFSKESTDLFPYLTAIRTKPFILLAGISGTGKSRIVRKLAQATDTIGTYTDDAARFACHKPENFCLIQVKPNWHNSMDVVGYKSNIGKNGEHYEYTDFIDFIAKAWQHPDVPFFLCLDEMNLAPVEEYFAEFLSAIESRSIDADGNYETDPIVRPFKEFGEDVCKQMIAHILGTEPDSDLAERFRTKGLTLPKNLIVMGTVNMDETTFSFSRKVLDRAMSIEMNEVDYDAFLEGSTEMDVPVLVADNQLLIERAIKAQDVKDNIDAEAVKDFLNSVNNVLEGTPFKLGYRAANEAMLYVSAAKDFGNDNLAAALDEFTLMKILSRIEGDDSKLRTMLGENLLDELQKLFLEGPLGTIASSKTFDKLNQMIKSLERDHFVSFWG